MKTPENKLQKFHHEFFKYWAENDPIGFYKIFWETINEQKLGTEHEFCPMIYDFDVPHYLELSESFNLGEEITFDIEIKTIDDMEHYYVVSNHIEIESPRKKNSSHPTMRENKINDAYKSQFSKHFNCYPDDLLMGGKHENYFQLAKQFLYLSRFDLNRSEPYIEKRMIYVYYDFPTIKRVLVKFNHLLHTGDDMGKSEGMLWWKAKFYQLSFQQLYFALKQSFLYTKKYKTWFRKMEQLL